MGTVTRRYKCEPLGPKERPVWFVLDGSELAAMVMGGEQDARDVADALNGEAEANLVIQGFNLRGREALARLGLSKAPDAGSLKSDEAWSAVAIMEREINRLREAVTYWQEGHRTVLIEWNKSLNVETKP